MNRTTIRPPRRKLNPPTPAVPKVNPQLTVAVRPVADLRLDPRNPRAHGKRQIGQIARSIKAFGFNVPVLVDAQDQVIAGHGRVLACRELGWDTIPTIRLDHLTPEQARAYAIADNRLTETSSWNDQLLAETLRDLSLVELDFDLEAIGFTMGEIDLRIEGLTDPPKDEPDPADAPFPVAIGPAVTQPGDLWLLGRHRLLCGDALHPIDYAQLMNGTSAAMVFTDPPYNVPISGHVSGLGTIQHREFAMASGEMTPAEFTTFLSSALQQAAMHSRDGSIHFICMDWRHLSELLAAGKVAYSELKNLCIWAKDNAGMGSLYRSQHELVLVNRRGKRTPLEG